MLNKVIHTFTVILFFLVMASPVYAQHNKPDTFFLAKKKGLLGRFGKMISTNGPLSEPVKVENQFLKFKGKIIRYIDIVRLGFERNINDTDEVKKNFGISVANLLHKNSRENTISRNLFFEEGQRLYPYLLADNERYLRDLVYIQDARILVDYAEDNTDSVDVVVLTKDIFSIGGKLVIDSKYKGRAELKEENFNGTGSKVMVSGFYDGRRNPHQGFGAEIVKRNIRGSFIDWTTGFQNYNPAFNTGRREETAIYTKIEKPLVTPFIPSTGVLEGGYYKTSNAYVSDSLYKSYYRYEYFNLDGWFGYSLDSKRKLYANKEIRRHRFLALRGFNKRFLTVPATFKTDYDYRYSDITGVLLSMNIFKQVYYKTNFIYGFGRNEDIPEGFNIAFTGGYVSTQSIRRPYSGVDAQFSRFNKKGYYYNFIFRAGGYYHQSRFEDVDLLFELDHFTRLKKMGPTWFMRSFINTGITAQVNPKLNAPLYLNSIYGLPYFQIGTLMADLRASVKAESVFYNTHKILGFRLAPFVFGDASVLKPSKMGLQKSELYSAVGGGVRTRNENLVFGTIELKGYFFPRTTGDMNSWKVELNSNIRFKYNSSFIRRPDFIIAN